MEAAGALPPVDKMGRGGKPMRAAGATKAKTEDDGDADDAPLPLEDDERVDAKNPPGIEADAL
jgi:hypothetical protein